MQRTGREDSTMRRAEPRKNSENSLISRRQALKASSAVAIGAAAGLTGFPAIVRSAGMQKFGRPIIAPIGSKPDEPFYVAITGVQKILKEKYDWEINMLTQPYGTLGSNRGQLVSVQSGFIDIAPGSTGNWSSLTKLWQFMDMPYLFDDWEHAMRTVTSDVWWETAKKMEDELGTIKVLPASTSGGFRMLSNNTRKLITPNDVQGLKFRTTASPLDVGLIRSWGGNPSPIDWFETYTSIQQNVVNGIHVQPYWTHRFNFFEVLKHATEVRAVWAVNVMVMNRQTYEAMPEALQDAFMEAAKEASDIANKKDWGWEELYKDKLRQDGVDVYKPSEAEYQEWRKAGETVWESDAAKSIDKSMVDKVMAQR